MAYGDPKISAVILSWHPSTYASICKPYIRNTKPQITSLGKIKATKQTASVDPSAARSEVCVLGRSLEGLRVRIPSEAWMSFVSVLNCQLVVAATEGILQSAECLSVTVKRRKWGGPGPTGAVAPWKKIQGSPSVLGSQQSLKKGKNFRPL